MPKLKQKEQKTIGYGSKEWRDAINKVADYLDEIDKFFWKIADIAVKIPSSLAGWKSPIKTFKMEFTPLQQFAMEVSKHTKRYKNWQSAYTRISQARSLRQEYEPEEVHEKLTVSHHAVAARFIPDKKERHVVLERAEKESWSAEKLAEHVRPKPLEIEPYEEYTRDFFNGLRQTEAAMENLENNLDKLSKRDRDDIANSLFVFVKEKMPRFLKGLGQAGADIHPAFKNYYIKRAER